MNFPWWNLWLLGLSKDTQILHFRKQGSLIPF